MSGKEGVRWPLTGTIVRYCDTEGNHFEFDPPIFIKEGDKVGQMIDTRIANMGETLNIKRSQRGRKFDYSAAERRQMAKEAARMRREAEQAWKRGEAVVLMSFKEYIELQRKAGGRGRPRQEPRP